MSSPSDTDNQPLLWLLRLQAFSRLSPIALGSIFSLLLMLMFWACGTFDPPVISPWNNKLQMLGQALCISVLGPYLFVITIYSIRLAEKTLDKLRPQLDYDDELHARWRNRFSHHPLGSLIFYTLAGIGAAFVILYSYTADVDESPEYFHPVNISFGISLAITWVLTLQGFFIAIRNALNLSRVARAHLKIKLWRLEAMAPFVHLGVQHILLVAGALAVMPLQALDVQFRLINYLPPFLIGVPLAVILLFLPVWGVHRKIADQKAHEIERVQVKLDAYGLQESLSHESITQINALIQYKQHLKALPTWPIELPDVYRLAFYLIIPPISWTGAALMQKWLV